MEKKNIDSFLQVKEKELTKFDAVGGGYVPGESPGFEKRDLLRFFMVDVIILLCLRLLYMRGLLPSLDHYVVSTLIGKCFLAAYLWRMVATRPAGWRRTGAATVGRVWAWPLALVLFAAAVPAVNWLAGYNISFVADLYGVMGWEYVPTVQDVALAIFAGDLSWWVRVVLVVFAALVGPVMEEVAFRGVGMDGFGKNGAASAALWTSVLFGVYHFDPSRLLPLAAIGALLAVGRVLANSLWCCVFLHVGYNASILYWMWQRLGETA